MLKIHEALYLDHTAQKGRGVFTMQDIAPMTVVEISSVLVLDRKARELLDQTPLYNYIFEWGPDQDKQCCVAWGYVSMYNHSYRANCEYFMDFEEEVIRIRTVRPIAAGDELTINCNGDGNAETNIWCEASHKTFSNTN